MKSWGCDRISGPRRTGEKSMVIVKGLVYLSSPENEAEVEIR